MPSRPASQVPVLQVAPALSSLEDFPVGFRVIISEERQEFTGELHSVGWLDSRGKAVVVIIITLLLLLPSWRNSGWGGVRPSASILPRVLNVDSYAESHRPRQLKSTHPSPFLPEVPNWHGRHQGPNSGL